MSGLAAIVTLGCDGGSGGVVSGLAATVTLGCDGGSGGVVSGLAATVTLGCDGGSGGLVSGLATATLAMATNETTKTKLRTFSELAVMNLRSLTTEGTMQVKSNPKVLWGLQQK